MYLPKLELIGSIRSAGPDPGPCLSPRAWWLALALASVALVVPLALTPMPPLLDYPNHLARMVVLERGAADPVLSAMYVADWHILPNIAIDMLMPPLLHVLPLHVVGRLFIALALLLPFAGTVVLHRTLFGRRSLWPFAAVLVVYNQILFLGFLNYLIGLGLALFGTALWVRMAPLPATRLVVAAILAVALFFCHLIALAMYGLLLFAVEMGAWWDRPASQHRRIASFATLMTWLAVPFVIPAVLYLRSPLADAPGGVAWFGRMKLHGVFGPFITYNLGLDLLAMFAVGIFLAWCWWQGHLLVARAGAIGFGILMVLYALVPFEARGTGFIDQRLPPLGALLVFAITQPYGLKRPLAPVAGVVLAMIAMARLTDIGAVWIGHNRDLVAFQQVIAGIRPAENVLAVAVRQTDVPQFGAGQPRSRFLRALNLTSIMHLPALVLIERDAFWPLLFTAATKQPLRVRPAYAGLAVEEGLVPSYRALEAAAADGAPPRDAPYLAHWQRDFDYVLLLHAGKLPLQDQPLLPGRLELLKQADVAALYRVHRPDEQREPTPAIAIP